MLDSFHREIDYVRLSVTDRCDLRCTYCMPATGLCFFDKKELLTLEDRLYLLTVLAKEGVKKVKITGGEPLANKDTPELIEKLKRIPGIEKVTLTTNGTHLHQQAKLLKAAGIDGINISIDTVNPEAFHQLTRIGRVEQVLAGLTTSLALGLPNIKINTVARAELTDQEIIDVVKIAKNAPVHIRFIELMPIGLGKTCAGKTQEEISAILETAYGPLVPYSHSLGNGPATYYSLPNFQGKIGFISAIGHCFCSTCDRIRVTANGCLKTCLHMDDGVALKQAIQARNTKQLVAQIKTAIKQKPEKHHFLETAGDCRFMSQIGG